MLTLLLSQVTMVRVTSSLFIVLEERLRSMETKSLVVVNQPPQWKVWTDKLLLFVAVPQRFPNILETNVSGWLLQGSVALWLRF